MKRFGIMALVVAGLWSTSASADFSIQNLLEACTKKSETFCLGYIAGAADSSDKYCLKEPMTYGAYRQVFVNWAQKHPEFWSKRAVDGVVSALHSTWPCKPKK